MAVVKIRQRGRTDKPVADEAPKPTPRKSITRKSTTRPATKAAETPAKRGPGRPRKSVTAEPTTARIPQRRASPGIDPRDEAKLLKIVQKAGARRLKAEEEHKESVNALHEVAQEAMNAGVSMAKVADASGISRQWLYKMGSFRGRDNGNGGNGKAAAPKATVTRSTAGKGTRKSTTKSTLKQAGGTRRRIRSAA